jgi:hypothetical protein
VADEIDWEDVAINMPHGSGIDGEWSVEHLRSGTVVLHNSYHGMNDCGMYDGWVDFRVAFSRFKADETVWRKGTDGVAVAAHVIVRKGDWYFKVLGRFSSVRHKSWGYGLQGYLEDTVSSCLMGGGYGHLCGIPRKETA